jgi:hypothetical protein
MKKPQSKVSETVFVSTRIVASFSVVDFVSLGNLFIDAGLLFNKSIVSNSITGKCYDMGRELRESVKPLVKGRSWRDMQDKYKGRYQMNITLDDAKNVSDLLNLVIINCKQVSTENSERVKHLAKEYYKILSN